VKLRVTSSFVLWLATLIQRAPIVANDSIGGGSLLTDETKKNSKILSYFIVQTVLGEEIRLVSSSR